MAWVNKSKYLDYVTYNQDEMAEERNFSLKDFISDGSFSVNNKGSNNISINGGVGNIGGFYIKVSGESNIVNTANKKFVGIKITSIPAVTKSGIGSVNVELYVHDNNDIDSFNKVTGEWINSSYILHLYTKESDGTYTAIDNSRGNTLIDSVNLYSEDGNLWFDVNGKESNKIPIDFTGITQRVLTLSDIGLVDADFPNVEDNDAFLNFLFPKIPNDSILSFRVLAADNVAKNFPFQDCGFITCYKFSSRGAIRGTIQYYMAGGVDGVELNDMWVQEVSFSSSTSKYTTRGYSPMNGGIKTFSYKIPKDSEYTFNQPEFKKYDVFDVYFTDEAFSTFYESSRVETWGLGKDCYLSSSYSSGYTINRGFNISGDTLKVTKRSASGTLQTSRYKGMIIIAQQRGLFKNSESREKVDVSKSANIMDYMALKEQTLNYKEV